MMHGFISGPSRRRDAEPLRYRVERRQGGWSVVINACATRPMADKARVEALARSLQAEADGLRHETSWRVP